MTDSNQHGAPRPLFAVGGVASEGRPGGLALIDGSSVEVIDALDVAGVRRDGTRLERALADGERRAIYDQDGLLAIGPIVHDANADGSVEASHGAAAAVSDSAVHENTQLEPRSDAESAHTGDVIARLVNPADDCPYLLLSSGNGGDTKVELPFGEATGVALVDEEIAHGLRIGGRVNATRVSEARQERAFRAAGVTATSLWASGAPLAIPDCYAEIEVDNPSAMEPGARTQTSYRLTNLGSAILTTSGPCPVSISARWHDPATGTEISDVVHFRNPLEQPVPPGVTHQGSMTLGAPSTPGTYHVQVTLLQENVRWFSDADDRSAAWLVIEVGANHTSAAGGVHA